MLAANILEIKTSLGSGTYGIGDTIPFEVVYNEPVDVTTYPEATLNFNNANGTPAQAAFNGVGSNNKSLRFLYTVLPGDSVANFDVMIGAVPAPGFLTGSVITTASNGSAADKDVATGDPTLARFGISLAGTSTPAVPTVNPTTYVNPSVYAAGTWASLHDEYFVVNGTIGDARSLAANETLRVTINGATYAPPVTPNGTWSVRILPVGPSLSASVPVSGSLDPWSTTNAAAYNVVATLTDPINGSRTDTTTGELVIDTLAPTISSIGTITPPRPNGYFFKVGDVIDVYVAYDEAIRVIGSPSLQVNATPASFAPFAGVLSNGTEVHFQYLVKPGDNFTIVPPNPAAISLNGGYIEDLAANAAPITSLPPAAPNNLLPAAPSPITVDTTAPTVTGVTSISGNGTYVAGSPVITITAAFSENVFVAGGVPTLALNSGGTATYAGGSGTSTLSFTYSVLPGEDSADLDYVTTTSLSLNGATITDAAGNNATLTLAAPGSVGSLGNSKAIVVADQPQVVSVGVDSAFYPSGTYSAGDTIKILVDFDKVVTVTAGLLPGLQLNTVPARIATWSGYVTPGTSTNVGTLPANATSVLEFTYVVQPGDTTGGGNLNYTSPFDLTAGAGINLVWTGVAAPNLLAADLTLPVLGTAADKLFFDGIKIAPDTVAPLAPTVSLTADTANAAGQWTTDGITSNPVITVTGLETKVGGTWEYQYQYTGGTASGWLPGTGTSFTLATTAAPGGNVYAIGNVQVRQTDSSGNVSPIGSNAVAWTIDVNAPIPPATATVPTSVAGYTNDPTFTLTGLYANALVQYSTTFNGTTGTVAGFVLPPTTGDGFAGGAVTFTLPLVPATYAPGLGTGIAFRQQDLAGNFSAWKLVVGTGGVPTIIVTLDTTIPTPTMALATDTTPGFAPYTGAPFTTDGITSVGTVNVGNLEVANLFATPPVTGIANWQYSTDGGGTWQLGGTTAPTGTFALVDTGLLPGGTVYAAGQVQVRETDNAGNTVTVSNGNAWTIDQTAPTVQTITAPSGTYTAGQTLIITVGFGESVYLSGTTPTLTLDTGATATLVTPVTAGATSLQFRYVVAPGQTSSALTVTALNLGTTILADRAGNVSATPLLGLITIPGTVVINAAIAATSPTLPGSAVAPGPARTAALGTIQIVFNTPVTGFSLNALRLYWNPNVAGVPTRAISLKGATIRRINSTTYTVTLPKAATSAKGAYLLTVGSGGGIRSALNPAAVMTQLSNIYFRRT